MIISLDLSTKSTGYAIWDQGKLVQYKCIRATSPDTIARIKKMSKEIAAAVDQYHPTQAIIEEVLPEDVRHNQTVYKALMYLQAAIVFVLHSKGVKYDFYVASHWRKTIGIGTGRYQKRDSLKKQVQDLVLTKYGLNVNDDIADAIGIGMAYILEFGSNDDIINFE